MDPSRKRRLRLIVSLAAALVLATALIVTSFNASSEAKTPSELLASADAGRSYQLTGKVADGSIRRAGDVTTFDVRDRAGTATVRVKSYQRDGADLRFEITARDGTHPLPVAYTGVVPDPFREGREIIVTVRRQGGQYVGEKDSLITKCPSKFSDEQNAGVAAPADH